MKFKNVIIILSIILLSALIFKFIVNRQNNILSEENLAQHLFPSKNYNPEFSLECYEDLYGISTDGSMFYFYKYKLDKEIIISNLSSFPQFKSAFTSGQLKNIESATWLPTPIKKENIGYHTDIASLTNLANGNCSKDFFVGNYLKKQGCYYSYFAAYPVGTYLFIYAPTEKSLFIIRKK